MCGHVHMHLHVGRLLGPLDVHHKHVEAAVRLVRRVPPFPPDLFQRCQWRRLQPMEQLLVCHVCPVGLSRPALDQPVHL